MGVWVAYCPTMPLRAIDSVNCFTSLRKMTEK